MGKGKKEDGGMGCEGEGKIGMRERRGTPKGVCTRRARVQVGFMLACVVRSVRAGIMGKRYPAVESEGNNVSCAGSIIVAPEA